MIDTRARQRRVQIVFLVLMALSTTQVLWWILDQNRRSREVQERFLDHYTSDLKVATALVDEGKSIPEVAALFPHLEITAGREFQISPAAMLELNEERRSRLNQYTWEGGFFVLVLIAGMGVIWRTVHYDAELRLRQRNFLAAVSHELKSPLASMQLTAETLSLRQPPPERRQKLIQRLLVDLERLGALTSNMLDASRLEQGRVEVARRPLRMTAVVPAAVKEMQERAADVDVELVVEPVDDTLVVEADPVGMRTVLRNLIDNAIKSCQVAGGGTVTLSVRLDQTAHKHKDRVVLDVTDNGMGFPPEAAEKIFGQFFRLGDELRRSTPGTGLGLSITRRILALEKATIRARSDGPGQGAVLTVSWPLASAKASAPISEQGLIRG